LWFTIASGNPDRSLFEVKYVLIRGETYYMKYLKQFCLILAVTCVGEVLSLLIDLPVPGSIYGLVLMFLLLLFKIIPVEAVKETGEFLIEIMPVMFIPAAVGLLEAWGTLKPVLLPVCVITVVSTFVVMFVTGKVTDAVIRIVSKKEAGKEKVPRKENDPVKAGRGEERHE